MYAPILSQCKSFMTGVTFSGACFLSRNIVQAHFGWHSALCIFKMNASWGIKLCSDFNFYSLYNIKRPALLNKWLGVLGKGFSSPKNFRDCRETGPWARLLQACLELRGIQNQKVALIYINPNKFSANLLRRTRLWAKFMDFVINTVPRLSRRGILRTIIVLQKLCFYLFACLTF